MEEVINALTLLIELISGDPLVLVYVFMLVFILLFVVAVGGLYLIIRRADQSRRREIEQNDIERRNLINQHDLARQLEIAQLKAFKEICERNLTKVEVLEKDKVASDILVQQLQANLTDAQDSIKDLNQKLSNQINVNQTAQDKYTETLNDMRAEYEDKIKALKDEHGREIEAMKSEHKRQMDGVNKQLERNRAELTALNKRFEEVVQERNEAKEKLAETRGRLLAYEEMNKKPAQTSLAVVPDTKQ